MSSISDCANRDYGQAVTPVLRLLVGTEAPSADFRPIALLAEPDRLRGALIAAGLEDLGIDVVCVAQGDAALECAEGRSFDVHVADPSLRSRQGERVVQTLVVDHPRVPLIVTGSSAAALHAASALVPAAQVVDRVRAALGRPRQPTTWASRGRAGGRASL